MEFNETAFIKQIFDSKVRNFEELVFMIYSYQFKNNKPYQRFITETGLNPQTETTATLPFLPVEFFKSHEIKCGNFNAETIFTSSGTSGNISSRHFVKDVSVYKHSFTNGFRYFYGDINEYCILALLPSYLERKGSSLIMMTEELIKQSGHPLSGFYLNDFEKLFDTLIRLKALKQKTILLGVTFALLDFAENFALSFPELVIMETGGMKGKRKEIIREEIHLRLKSGLGVDRIHSEYGMTELLSQAYSKEHGKFYTPPWMQIHISDMNDPFQILPAGKSGIINVIDLANISSCAFIKTADIGKKNQDGSFEILGRMDSSDIRGCSLMYL